MSDSESDGGVPLIEAEFDTTASSKKRKREAEPEATKDSKKAAKKLKRKEKKKQKVKDIDEDDLDQQLGINHSFERMDGQLMADYINARTRLYGKELSSVELEDKFIPARTVRDSTSWSKPRTTDNLSAFLKQQCTALQPTAKKPVGAPHTIVVTASGIRAADLCRSLRSGLPKEGIKDPNVAKLFAKHMKLAEQVAHLKKNNIDFGVGTPDRLAALLEEKALSTANLKQVVIDVSYIDQKKRGILDMKELHESLIKFLLRRNFVGEGKERGDDMPVDESCLRHDSDGLRIGFSSSQDAVRDEACGTVRPAYQNPHERVEACDGGLVSNRFQEDHVLRRLHSASCQKGPLHLVASCPPSASTQYPPSYVLKLHSRSARDDRPYPPIPKPRHPSSLLARPPPPPSDKTPPYAADSSRATTRLLTRRCILPPHLAAPPLACSPPDRRPSALAEQGPRTRRRL